MSFVVFAIFMLLMVVTIMHEHQIHVSSSTTYAIYCAKIKCSKEDVSNYIFSPHKMMLTFCNLCFGVMFTLNVISLNVFLLVASKTNKL